MFLISDIKHVFNVFFLNSHIDVFYNYGNFDSLV